MFKHFAVITAVALVAGAAVADTPLPRLEPNVVFSEGVGGSFLFPVAGSVEGANGAHFRSEVTLVNFKNEPQEVIVEFLPQGAAAPTVHRVEIEGRRFRFWEDFVATEIGRPGILGALTFRAVVTGTTISDASARLDAFSRIWTQIPGTNGTTSMSLPAIDAAGLTAPNLESAFIIGLRQDAQYRTNVGIVNLENFDRTFTVEATNTFPSRPVPAFSVTVRARSMRQVSLPEGHFGGLVFRITPTSAGAWSAYAASVDNFSGDGWVSQAQYSTRQ